MDVGAVRVHGNTLHAWVAKRGHINDGGIVFPERAYDRPQVVQQAPLFVEDEPVGRVFGVAASTDDYLVAMCTIHEVPRWLLGETLAYSVAEFSADHLQCPICRSIIRKGAVACECVVRAPALLFSNICVEAVRIMPLRRDDYIEEYRQRALSRFLTSTVPNAAPGFVQHEPRTAIPQDSQSAKLPKPPGYGGAL